MRRLLLIPLLFCAVAAFGQALHPIYTIGTNGGSNPCFAGTTCTMHPTTTAGDTLAIGLTVAGSGGITAVSGGCSGSWAHPANVRQVDTTSGWSLDVWKCDSASGGTPTITATTATTPKGGILVDIPYGSGASGVFDTSGGQVSASTLTPTGVPLTLATADEIILQFSFYDNAVATCQVPTIDTYYLYGVCQTEVGTGPSRSVAIQENGAYGSVPQLTYTGTAATSVQSAIAFKILGSTPAPVWQLAGTTAFTNSQVWGIIADGSGNLYVVSDNATVNGVQYSSDHGATWSALNTGLTVSPASPRIFNGGVSYNGTVFVTNWAASTNYAYYLSGSSWIRDTTSSFASGGNYAHCANVTISAASAVICPLDTSGVLVSTNGGQNWTVKGASSLSGCAQVLGVGQTATGGLYASCGSPAGTGGVYYSTDANTWTQMPYPSQVTARAIDIGEIFIMPMGTYAGYMCTYFKGTVDGLYCYGPGDYPSGSWTAALNNVDLSQTTLSNIDWFTLNRANASGASTRVFATQYPGSSSHNSQWPAYTDNGKDFVFGGFGLPYVATSVSLNRITPTVMIAIDPNTGIAYMDLNINSSGTGGAQVYSTTVTQDVNAVVSSSLSPSTATINLNQSQQETVTYTYADATTGSVCPAPNTNSWNSASPLVATVNSSGLVSPVSSGTAVITNVCNGITSSSATITVNGTPTLTSITQSCTPTSLIQNGTGTCTVTCHYSDSSTSNCGGALGYTTDNSACVTIAANGVTGLYTAAPTLNQTCTANVGLTIGAISSTPTAISVNSYPPAALFGTVQVLGTATIIP